MKMAAIAFLALINLAPVQRKGAEHGGETLLRLARPAGVAVLSESPRIPRTAGRSASISNLYSADFARSYILRTNYPAPSPVSGAQESPVVKAVPISRAVAPPAKPVILPNFAFPTNAAQFPYWHRLDADSPDGPWKTNVTNMTYPPSGTQDVTRTNARGFFKLMGTREKLP